MPSSLDLIQGTLDVLILKALSWGPRHGYQIAEWILGISGDELRVEEGTLYPALHRLHKRGMVEAEWGLSDNNRRARFYELTPTGQSVLEARAREWQRYAAAVGRVLSAADPEPA